MGFNNKYARRASLLIFKSRSVSDAFFFSSLKFRPTADKVGGAFNMNLFKQLSNYGSSSDFKTRLQGSEWQEKKNITPRRWADVLNLIKGETFVSIFSPIKMHWLDLATCIVPVLRWSALCQFTCWLPGLGRPTFQVQKPAELIPVEFSLLVTCNMLDYNVMLGLNL